MESTFWSLIFCKLVLFLPPPAAAVVLHISACTPPHKLAKRCAQGSAGMSAWQNWPSKKDA
jgi:hypothetical protein